MDFEPDLRNIKWIKGWKDLPECYVRVKTPGVGSIINAAIPDPGLDKWIEEVGKEKADQITQAAWHRGTAMHIFIENYILKMMETKDPTEALEYTLRISPPVLLNVENIPENKINEGRELFYKFYYSDQAKDYSEIIGSEFMVHSPYYYYRGKADWLYNKLLYGMSVSDFKTSSKLIEKGSVKENKYKHQLGAYAGGVEDMYKSKGANIKVNYASIICIQTRSDIVQSVELFNEELEEYKQKFKTICRQYHIDNGQEFLFKT